MDKLFIQFFYKITEFPPSTEEKPFTMFQNGFSSVWNLANPKWVEIPDWEESWTYLRTNSECEELKINLPEMTDEVYVSCFSALDLAIVKGWANLYPKTKFIVGGSVIMWYVFGEWEARELKRKSNVEVNYELATSLFEEKVKPSDWKLIIPSEISTRKFYSYGLGYGCYWGKCTFCHLHTLPKSLVTFDVEAINNAPHGMVCLATPAFWPRHIKLLLELDYNQKSFLTFIRPTKAEYKELIKILPQLSSEQRRRIVFSIGVEFPSERMQVILNRGMTLREIADFIQLLLEYDMSITCTYLTCRPEITKDDLREAEEFFGEIKAYSTSIMHRFGPYIKQKPPGIPRRILGMTYGYTFDLDKEAQALDNQWISMLEGLPKIGRGKKVL